MYVGKLKEKVNYMRKVLNRDVKWKFVMVAYKFNY